MAGTRRGSVESRSAGYGDGEGEQEQRGQKADLTPAEVATLDKMITDAMPNIATIVPPHVNAAQYEAIILGMLHKDLKLAMAALRNTPSFMAALADCARLGLTPGDGYAFLVFKSKDAPGGYAITGTTEYTGELQLLQQTGLVRGVVAHVVFPKDHYELSVNAEDRPEFRKWGRGATDSERGGFSDKELDWALPSVNYGGGPSRDPGRLRGQLAFGYVVFHDGSTSPPVEMSRQEIMNHRAVSRNQDAWDGPFWRSWWLKTIIHELYKWVQKSTTWLQRQDTSRAALATSPLGLLTMTPPVTSVSGAEPAPAIGGNGEPARAITNGEPDPAVVPGSPAARAQRAARQRNDARSRDLRAMVAHFEDWGIGDPDERAAYATAILGDADPAKIRAGEFTDQQAAKVAGMLDSVRADSGDDPGQAREILDRLTDSGAPAQDDDPGSGKA